MNFLKLLFTPPIFEDEIKTQQAYMLHIILWTLVCVPIPFVVYTLAITPEDISRSLTQAIFGETVNIILLVMLRRGYVRAASIFQVGTFWFFFTVTAFTGTGVQSEAYLLGYGLVIAIGGILLAAGYDVRSPDALARLLTRLEKQMYAHARNLEFEQAAALRDRIEAIKARQFRLAGTVVGTESRTVARPMQPGRTRRRG